MRSFMDCTSIRYHHAPDPTPALAWSFRCLCPESAPRLCAPAFMHFGVCIVTMPRQQLSVTSVCAFILKRVRFEWHVTVYACVFGVCLLGCRHACLPSRGYENFMQQVCAKGQAAGLDDTICDPSSTCLKTLVYCSTSLNLMGTTKPPSWLWPPLLRPRIVSP